MFALFVILLVLRLAGGVLFPLMMAGNGVGFVVLIALFCGLTFWIEHRTMGSEAVQRGMLKRMKRLPRQRLYWLMVQANVWLLVMTVALFWMLIG